MTRSPWSHASRSRASSSALWYRVTLAVGLGAVVALLAVGIAGAVRTRVQRDQARSFALLLAGDTLHRLPFAPRDPFRQQLAARVSQYLASSDETDDPTQAAEAWEHLATEHSSSGRTAEARSLSCSAASSASSLPSASS